MMDLYGHKTEDIIEDIRTKMKNKINDNSGDESENDVEPYGYRHDEKDKEKAEFMKEMLSDVGDLSAHGDQPDGFGVDPEAPGFLVKNSLEDELTQDGTEAFESHKRKVRGGNSGNFESWFEARKSSIVWDKVRKHK
jgi:hypothetical protein